MEVYNYIEPSFLLAPYVKYYWELRLDSYSPDMQRIIPTGCVQLIFHRGSSMFSVSENDTQPKAFVSGQSVSYSDLMQMGSIDMLVVVFHPFGARAFLPMPVYEFYEREIAIDDLGDDLLKELGNRLHEAPDTQTSVALIEQYLLKKLHTIKSYNIKRVGASVNALNLQSGIDVRSLADISCLSYKQFGRVFSEYVGLNPKEFLRIVRFQRALYVLQNNPSTELAQLAFECGYYDQPHLIKEFKAFSGHTPREYLAICNPYSDYFSQPL